MKKKILLSALALLVFSTAAMAQSPLADAARREAARRKAVDAAKTPVQTTYTNDDLAKLPPRSVPVPPKPAATEVTTAGVAGTTTAPAAGTPAAPAADAETPKDEKYWRDRITTARSNLSRAEIFAESLQSRINALSTDIVNRDDPAQREKLAQDRQRALDELAKVQSEIKDFQKAIADIETEARKLSVPAGWLR